MGEIIISSGKKVKLLPHISKMLKNKNRAGGDLESVAHSTLWEQLQNPHSKGSDPEGPFFNILSGLTFDG